MHVGLVSCSLSTRAGGIFEIERSLALALADLGVGVSAWGAEDDRWPDDRLLWKQIPCRVHRPWGPPSIGYCPGLGAALAQSDCDLLHLQHLWMYPSVAVGRWSARSGKPYLVTPNGMLEPWALRNSAWKKRLAAALFEARNLRGAACLQANTAKELADFRAYGLRNPVAVIPNGVDLPNADTLKTEILKTETSKRSEDPDQVGAESRSEAKTPTRSGRKAEIRILLFLGRLHPKKGLVQALRAWSQLGAGSTERGGQNDGWRFVIAGWDQGGHEAELKRLCEELGLKWVDVRNAETLNSDESRAGTETLKGEPAGSGTSRAGMDFSMSAFQLSAFPHDASVVFVGPAFGPAKDALFRAADAFILPSHSEGLPMAVLEAWAYGLPVVMTPECNLPEGFEAGAAIRIEHRAAEKAESGNAEMLKAEPRGIEAGLRQLFEMSDVDRRTMGARGRALVEERFTWPKVAVQMREVYAWMLGGGQRPGCVEGGGGGGKRLKT